MNIEPVVFIDTPAVAVVGVFDPFLPEHSELFERLRTYAGENNLTPVVVVLDPHPASFLQITAYRPIYDDLQTRLKIFDSMGVAAVVIRFERGDLAAGAIEFFELVCSHVNLVELWLGTIQTLGSGRDGGPEAIGNAAERFKVIVNRLNGPAIYGSQALELVSKGNLCRAIQLVGHPPIRCRPASGEIDLNWLPGNYLALQNDEGARVPMTHIVDVCENGVGTTARWPDENVEKLMFVAGPLDLNRGQA